MARNNADCQNIMLDIVNACHGYLDKNTAVKGVRNLCRYFGGGMYYIPIKRKDGRCITEIRDTLSEAIGERGANIIIDKMMVMLGGLNIYIPLEISAFKDVIAEEIYRRNAYENTSMREIFKDYGISFNMAYILWKKGRRIKLNKEMKK
jgi:Mor family transcriptional regulator